ncbi:hypothetical protein B0A55_12249 [Friedmanniomyces simplex]|uniref:Uncharacterized protein n=1 Tax=Friedmanniomyces simplex TaxID=329884 RepID=A0A4U0WDB3_9PEZI|nr:hypothetical protein B0A55_12249 [Friedmanniomyces simplex]
MASRTSRTQVVDVEYRDSRTGERVYERKVQEVPWEELSSVRNRELALVRRESPPEPESRRYEERSPPRRGEEEYALQRVQRSRYRDDEVVPYRRDERDDRRAPRRGGGAAYDDADDSDSESSHERRRRHKRREGRRDRSEAHGDSGRSRRGDTKDHQQQQNDDGGGKLWYSMKDRRDGNFLERNFDSSYDGLIAAAAGAALGAITARSLDKHQGDGSDTKKQKVLKMVGGAVAGAAVLNVGENWYRVYTEEKEERKEEKEQRAERQKERENGFKSNGEVMGEGIEALQYV